MIDDSKYSSLTGILSDMPRAFFDTSGISSVESKGFEDESRNAWDKSTEGRCDFTGYPGLQHRGGVWFIFLWRRTLKGKTLKEIKSNFDDVDKFATAMSDFIKSFIESEDARKSWVIVTTPARRHLQNNFANAICEKLSDLSGVRYQSICATCKNLQRINPIFYPKNIPKEQNVIVIDDIISTGSTLNAMDRLLIERGKTVINLVGINNRK